MFFTCCKISAGISNALFGVQHGEELKRVRGPGCEISECVGHRVAGNDAGLRISGVAEALRA